MEQSSAAFAAAAPPYTSVSHEPKGKGVRAAKEIDSGIDLAIGLPSKENWLWNKSQGCVDSGICLSYVAIVT